jgi:hypothetical protein
VAFHPSALPDPGRSALWRRLSGQGLGTRPVCHTVLNNMRATSQSKGRTNLLDSVAGEYSS